jgi:tetratricopeptide (TPR) repeat protein
MASDSGDLLRQARQARVEGRLDDARRDLLAAADLLRQRGTRRELAQVLRDLGEMERRMPRLHDTAAARRHYEESVAVWRELDEPLRLAHTLRHLGDVHQDAGCPALAEPCYHEALAVYRGYEQTAPLDLANAIRSLAVLAGGAGREEEARGLWQEAQGLYAACGVEAGVAEAARRLAVARSAPGTNLRPH